MIVQTEPDRQAKLEERLQFETLLVDLSSRFVNVPPDQVDREIAEAQSSICECLGIDHSALWQASPDDPKDLSITHLHRSRDLAPPPDPAIATEMFPWALGKISVKEWITNRLSLLELPDKFSHLPNDPGLIKAIVDMPQSTAETRRG